MDTAALRTRLTRLDPTRHAPAPAHDAPALADLVSRIERLRLRGRVAHAVTDSALAATLGGALAAPGLIIVERRYPFWHRHGARTLAGLARAEALLPAWGHAGLPLFMDTETTGLGGGTGTIAFLVGLGWLADTGLTLRQYLITAFGAETALLDAVAQDVPAAATLVSYNGKSFDAPLLAARHRLARRPDPFANLPHLDLLHALRRAHGTRLPDYRLRTAEAHLLGYTRADDLPGAQAPTAWKRLLKARDAAQMPAVLKHNREDLVSLVALLAYTGGCSDGYLRAQHMRRPGPAHLPLA